MKTPLTILGARRLALALLLPALALAAPGTAAAQHVFGPRSAGMGETHRGIGTGNDTIFLNPAGMSLFPRYVVEAFWRRDTGFNETLFTLSVLDSRTAAVAGGIAYTYDYAGGDRRSGSRLDVATSYPIAGFLLLGTTVRYLFVNTDDGDVRRITGDAGMILRLGERVNLGVVGYNVLNPAPEGDAAPRTFGGGVGVVPLSGLVAGFDYRIEPEREDRPVTYSAGAEYFFLGHFALRAGWLLDQGQLEHGRPRQQLSGGASYVEEIYGLDFSYARAITGGPGYEIAIALRIFVN
jgi:hypothetical protein